MKNEDTWYGKKGIILISNMSDNYLQSAFNYTEKQYVKHNATAMKFITSAELFWDKRTVMLKESKRRNIKLVSMADKNIEKFAIIANNEKLMK